MNVDVFFKKLTILETAGELSFPDEIKAELWAVAKDMEDDLIEEVLTGALGRYFEGGNLKMLVRKFFGKASDWEPGDDA